MVFKSLKMFSMFIRNNNIKPRYCCWVLNYRCMFRCKMCYIWNIKDADKNEISLTEKKKFVESFRGFVGSDFEFHLSGGEPLLTDGIFELIKFIGSQGYRTNLVTNGYLIDQQMAEAIVDSGLDSLTISLDGITPETHDYIRGMPGSFDRVMRAITYLDNARKNKKPSISILTIIMERNMDEILKLTDWVEQDKRLGMISFQAITQPFCQTLDSKWYLEKNNHFLWPNDIGKSSAIMEKLRDLKNNGYKIGNNSKHFLHFRDYFIDPNRFLKRIKCNMGDYEFHVDPYGKAFFCCLTEPFGNIKNEVIPEIWNSDKTKDIRNDVYSCRKNCHIMINCFYEAEPEQ